MAIIEDFVARVQAVYKTGVATEHSYRSALEHLLNNIQDGITAINEPKRVKCGAPDFIVNRGEIPIGHLEAKDLNVDLTDLAEVNQNQKDRYLKALPNLIYSNCLDFEFYRDGVLTTSISIGTLGKGIIPTPENFQPLLNRLKDFVAQRPQTITSPRVLATIMAGKAALIRDVLFNALVLDTTQTSEIANQYAAFKQHLIHDITTQDFADIYAETLAYGMFAARLHDETPETFSRTEALDLLPKSNPFLRSLFGYIAGPDLDDRIKWIIDDLANVFQSVNVKKLMEGFGKLTGHRDPFLHFYETFLAAYNPTKRKARGVWYTPEPVVKFVVKAVDQVLRADFNLPDGLADTSKVTVNWDTGQSDKKGKPICIKKEVHRVQILDPATGTGTFLAEVIKQIAPKVKKVGSDLWSEYIETELIPRLHGFELLMASYAMCHMKLDMMLRELGYKPTGAAPRLSVFLTNSLEEGEAANQTLPFAQWLSNEVKNANTIKRDMPIMCVIGNPPYNASSKNKSTWIMKELKEYRKNLTGRKINLSDDYIKFIRMAETFIEKNGEGVFAMITNNSFLDGETQRMMRKHLMDTFDSIHIFDLHGDIRSRAAAGEDENVFDITQGVAITIMVRRKGKGGTNTIKYRSMYGPRKAKYAELNTSLIGGNQYATLSPQAPYYFFVDRNQDEVEDGFSLDDFIPVKSSGIQTKNDDVTIAWTKAQMDQTIADFQTLGFPTLEANYPSKKVWSTVAAQHDIQSGHFHEMKILYRPFDIRYTALTETSNGFLGRPRFEVMKHFLSENIALIVNKKHVGDYFSHAGVTNTIACHGTFYLGNRGQDYVCPLYLYPDEADLDRERRINFEPKLYRKLQKLAKDDAHGKPDELNVFDYIYGTLYSPVYRAEYAHLLKTNFPRIPWPASPENFWKLSDLGRKVRELHLETKPVAKPVLHPLVGNGDNIVVQGRYNDEKIYINDDQYFSNVPSSLWSFEYGGYCPAQKWLKDRRERKLSFEDIKHYQKMLNILRRTSEIMQGIDEDEEADAA
ncbi:type ISP restriction/modification enzyme [Agrobacterium deltaense]|uniref:type ISP restriction/modification enzyme n=1 Tax=Agrobacterium deltaense TaxID=1183412 RepID=UPI001C6ED3A8|nr:type ISP restriction/modification enzyme [Agrobacterium deltaense]MBW9075653.1 N-6 DNA methylase [Agrobacterium deltaense]